MSELTRSQKAAINKAEYRFGVAKRSLTSLTDMPAFPADKADQIYSILEELDEMHVGYTAYISGSPDGL